MASAIDHRVLEDPRPPSQIADNTSGAAAPAVHRSRNRKSRSQKNVRNGFDPAGQDDPRSQVSKTLATDSTTTSVRAIARPAKAPGSALSMTPPKDDTQPVDAELSRPHGSRRPRTKPVKSTNPAQRPYSTFALAGRIKSTNEMMDRQDREVNVIQQPREIPETHQSDSNADARSERPLSTPGGKLPDKVDVLTDRPAKALSGDPPEPTGPRRSRRLAKKINGDGVTVLASTKSDHAQYKDATHVEKPPQTSGEGTESERKMLAKDRKTGHFTQHDSDGAHALTSQHDPVRGDVQSDHVPQQTPMDNTSASLQQPSDLTSAASAEPMAPTTRSQSLTAALEGLSLDVKQPAGPKVKPLKEPKKPRPEKKPTKRATTTTTTKQPEPRLNIMPRPEPTHAYLHQAHQPPLGTHTFRPLLIILDLNGTLLKRKHKGGSAFHPRPGLSEFLTYLFTHHRVMVWSSARRENVVKICRSAFTPAQLDALVAIWSREDLQLSEEAFKAHSQVYKQLSWVWRHPLISQTSPVPGEVWNQANTVLIDDSTLKAASEPFNLLEVPEFTNAIVQEGEDVLMQVWRYLNVLGFQQDVSAYMRVRPFVYDRAAVEG